MGAPSATDILRVWDAGSGKDYLDRALLLLSLDDDMGASTDRGALCIGARDGLLLDLRMRLFGSRVESVNRCEACEVELSVAFDVAEIRIPSSGPGDGRVELACDGYEIVARSPTTDDLIAIRDCRTRREARDHLLVRCVVEIDGRASGLDAPELPANVQSEIVRALANADPQANVELLLKCAACGAERHVCFDIVRYLWAEIEEYGSRTLRQVHQLARAYGWTEAETLALPPQRRHRYLEMVSNG